MSTVAVAGASGNVGREVVAALEASGHDVVPLSRSHGVDVLDGAGLEESLAGVVAVVDALNTEELEAEKAAAFFGTSSANLLAAEQRAGVGHHVALSIVNVDRMSENGHYTGKQAQEAAVRQGQVPWTILRATQFFDFPELVAGWTTDDRVATLPPIVVQAVDPADVAHTLADLAVGRPLNRHLDLAGPDRLDFPDMARRIFAVRGVDTEVRESWDGQPFTREMAGDALLPDGEVTIAPTSFDQWLRRQA